MKFYLIKKFIKKIFKDDIFALSAQFSYYMILAIFPFILLVVIFLSQSSTLLYEILNEVKHLIPPLIYDLFYGFINSSVSSYKSSYFSTGIILLIWSASSGSTGIIKAINKAYDSTNKRNFIYMRFIGIVFVLALMISIQLVLIFIVGGNYIINFLIKATKMPTLLIFFLKVIRYVIPIVLLTIMLALIYKFIPSTKIKFTYVIPGTITASFGCLINSIFFSSYISNRLTYYNNIYGNLSGIFILLLWINITSFIFLLGNEINAFIIDIKSKKIW